MDTSQIALLEKHRRHDGRFGPQRRHEAAPIDVDYLNALLADDDTAADYGDLVVDNEPHTTVGIDGSRRWLNPEGELHRIEGPALIGGDGEQVWYRNGIIDRVGGPAIIQPGRNQQWWRNGKLHRIDGPAFEHDNGDVEWYVNGMRHRIDGPAVVAADGAWVDWWRNDKLHRVDGPARVRPGRAEWWRKGRLHRVDGPAVVTATGERFYLDGKPVTEAEFLVWRRAHGLDATTIPGQV